MQFMPTELGQTYDLDWRGKPPHMLEWDIPVWYRFLTKWGFNFEKLYYDCAVGGQYYSENALKDKYVKMWSRLNAKRIDALGESSKTVWIIEVSTSPGLRAIGQLLVYRNLWNEDPKIEKPVIMVLVCSVVEPDFLASAAALNIKIFVMPGDDRQTIPV
ncbi:hypothetical protein LCGC14_0910440 [marine sediment metagenome]|uniref:Uncharacterized protein n=1 Tax=marine sediment metagenome TaxID=412755 RepID=A0A0F9NTW0_9ZZZZ